VTALQRRSQRIAHQHLWKHLRIVNAARTAISACSGKCPKRPAVSAVLPAVWANTTTTCTESSWVCLTPKSRVCVRKAILVSRTAARKGRWCCSLSKRERTRVRGFVSPSPPTGGHESVLKTFPHTCSPWRRQRHKSAASRQEWWDDAWPSRVRYGR